VLEFPYLFSIFGSAPLGTDVAHVDPMQDRVIST